MRGVLIGGGGFLLAVLWMDLLFDLQTLAHPRRAGDVPEPVLASIAAYYRRVTTEASPLGHLIGLVMLITLGGAVVDLVRGGGPFPARMAAVALAGVPIGLAAARVLPRGSRRGDRTAGPRRTGHERARAGPGHRRSAPAWCAGS